LARYNVALKNSIEMQVNFQEGLPFLTKYVETARAQGAREYKKVQASGVVEN